MNKFLDKLLKYYDLSLRDYEKLTAEVTKENLPTAEAFFNFESFISRIEKAIASDENVVIYGDYDADGILATSILKYAFLKRGKDVFTMIPSRYKDGYGLNTNVVEKFSKRAINLLLRLITALISMTQLISLMSSVLMYL